MKTGRTLITLGAIMFYTQATPWLRAQHEITFVEKFALSADRETVLKELIPGTEDYYFFHALHYQHTGQKEKLAQILTTWRERTPNSPLLDEVTRREALINYEKDPKGTIAYLIEKLGIQFNHAQETLNQKPNLPTAVDPKQISEEAFAARALAVPQDLGSITGPGLIWLLENKVKLSTAQKRILLSRIERPDAPGLLELINADLRSQESRGFGEFPIHRQLFVSQLAQLKGMRPALMDNMNFIQTWLGKLRPNADVSIEQDVAAREAWLDASWAFVKDLNPAFNSLKAHILYTRLVHDQKLGKRDKDRFLEYLKLPRHAFYVAEKYQEREELFKFPADLNANYTAFTGCMPIGNDEPLLREYLLFFLADAKDTTPFLTYLRDTYLNPLFAEANLTAGIGNAEKWFSLLDPSAVQALRERVDIDFDVANPETLEPGKPVSLTVNTKNTPSLAVNVYEINTENHARTSSMPIGTDINLDGLSPNFSATIKSDAAPILRKTQKIVLTGDAPADGKDVAATIKIPGMSKRGVWIADLIGNGKSSRALIRIGQLRYVTRPSSAGTVIIVLDENQKPIAKAYAQLGGQRLTANERGEIIIPFSNKPGNQPVVLGDGDGFAQQENITIQGENYALSCGFHAPRESLIAGKMARVILRPTLNVNGAPMGVGLLEEVKLNVTSTNHDGVNATSTQPDFKLEDGKDATYEFRVPERLSALNFQLVGKVKSLISGQKVDVAASFNLTINGQDKTAHTSDLYLNKIGANYFLQELGRTGEARAERAIAVDFRRPEFVNPITLNLKTDAGGFVNLGSLDGVVAITAHNQTGINTGWTLATDRFSYPANLHIQAGKPINLPCLPDSRISLIEVANGTFVRGISSKEKAKGDEPGWFIHQWEDKKSADLWVEHLTAGDYTLKIDDAALINIRVTAGEPGSGWLLGRARVLEAQQASTLFFPALEVNGENLIIDAAKLPKSARVHVFASRFLPDFNAFEQLGDAPGLEPLTGVAAFRPSLYVSGRKLGEEYSYVLERKNQKKFPGNMLPRPGLLLNPWAIRTTETAMNEAAEGESFRRALGGQEAKLADAQAKKSKGVGPGFGLDDGIMIGGLSNMDFLAEIGFTNINLTKPDGDGKITIKLADLGDRQFIRVLAVSGDSAMQRDISLPDRQTKLRDLRLRNGLDPAGHFTRQNQITILEKDAPFVVKDAVTAELETVSDLGQAFTLLRTLSNNPTLIEFSFITDWPKLENAKKRELYSKYACHELSFFLSRKDPEFFKTVILPYLANKRDKTFMDHYLLGADVKDYLRPWNYERLNIAERILLAQRLQDEAASIGREIKDHCDLLPPNVEQALRLFESSLGYLGLGGGAMAGELSKLKANEAKFSEAGATLSIPQDLAAAPAPEATAPTEAIPQFAKVVPADAARPMKKPAVRALARDAKVQEQREELAKELEAVEALAENQELADKESDSKFRADGAMKVQLYRKLEQTKEWAENNYYNLLIEQQNAGLITVNKFWKDYALWDGKGGFLSTNLAEAARNFPEMMLALSVLDLPFPGGPSPKTDVKDGSVTITPTNRMILFHREIKPAELDAKAPRLLVSQNYYRNGDRFIQKDGEQLDKFASEEFLSGIVYGCQVVVTNPTSSVQKLDLLVQIPQGAIPVLNSKQTLNLPLRLEAYRTHTMDYFFYFPKAGKYPQHPVHVSKAEKVVAFADAFEFNVVDELTKLDTLSWDYISQYGKPEEVLAFLDQNNVHGLNLDRMAWRMKDKDFFAKAVALLEKRHAYHHTTWSYSLQHNDLPSLREFLQHNDAFIQSCGYLDCTLVKVDPIARRMYQHLEYSPLINARAHQLGAQRTILNDRFHAQYEAFLQTSAHKPALNAEDQLAATYYLLLQDRVQEAMDMHARAKAGETSEKLQTDYLNAVLAFYQEDTKAARQLAEPYLKHPVDKWREKFTEVIAQLDEIEGRKPANPKEDDREQLQNALAVNEPAIDFTVESKEVRLNYHNVKEAVVNYYPMDLEFLFSTAPIVGSDTNRFGMIKPNKTEKMVLPDGKDALTFALPKEYHSSNVLVEISAGGKSQARAYYANELNIQMSENFGRLQVLHATDNRPLAKVYVKVFAEINGQPKFYKDGYTDLRGKFDYASLSTGEIDQATRFSVLVMSEEHGAAVKEAKPPRQ